MYGRSQLNLSFLKDNWKLISITCLVSWIPLNYFFIDSPAAQLPRNWNRPYLGYNPRVDRELGSAAELARSERVFSDSEIYSPVFPRGRHSPTKGNTDSGSAAAEAVSARVEAMRKEFAEYQREQILSNTKNSDNKSSPASKSSTNPTSTEAASAPSVQTKIDELEIPLRAPKLQRPPSSSPPPPPSNTSPFSGLENSEKKIISSLLKSGKHLYMFQVTTFLLLESNLYKIFPRIFPRNI